jgi:hypothetical protein
MVIMLNVSIVCLVKLASSWWKCCEGFLGHICVRGLVFLWISGIESAQKHLFVIKVVFLIHSHDCVGGLWICKLDDAIATGALVFRVINHISILQFSKL